MSRVTISPKVINDADDFNQIRFLFPIYFVVLLEKGATMAARVDRRYDNLLSEGTRSCRPIGGPCGPCSTIPSRPARASSLSVSSPNITGNVPSCVLVVGAPLTSPTLDEYDTRFVRSIGLFQKKILNLDGCSLRCWSMRNGPSSKNPDMTISSA